VTSHKEQTDRELYCRLTTESLTHGPTSCITVSSVHVSTKSVAISPVVHWSSIFSVQVSSSHWVKRTLRLAHESYVTNLQGDIFSRLLNSS